MILRIQKHMDDKLGCRLEVWTGNIDNVVCATEWKQDLTEDDIKALRMKLMQMLADIHNMLSEELRIA